MNKCFKVFLLTVVLGFISGQTVMGAQVFGNGAPWKYILGTAEASSPVEAWRQVEFDDSTWSSGTAPLGYGEPDIASTLPTSSAGGYRTVYLRKDLFLGDPADISQIDLELAIDDGAVAYINGVEVLRYNVPPGELAFNALASTAPTQWTLQSASINGAALTALNLQPGTNILAVHLINGSDGSSDIYLDGNMARVLVDPIPPVIAAFDPPEGLLTELSQVSVTFSETVTGVTEDDLLINGQSASSVSASGGNAYVFRFPQPAYGDVQVSWAASHGIVDEAVPPNPFDETAPETSWQYDLQDLIAPTVASVNPARGTTVLDLSQIVVTFSENVTGVDVSDLLVNGVAATNASTISLTQYAFEFAAPSTGTVMVAFAPGHGITDLAASPNNFAGEQWTYTLDPQAVASQLFITEFMSINNGFLLDEDGDESDWIEIHNAGDITANLDGWYLTDNPGNLTKWRFPGTNLASRGYMIVFASEKDRDTVGTNYLHTNFKLAGGGEYLALVMPDGVTVTSEYTPDYPPQVANISYGLPTTSAPTVLLAEDAPAKVLVPLNANLGTNWLSPIFDDSSWQNVVNGVGFEREPGVTPNLSEAINTDIEAQMHMVNSTVYLRYPLTIPNPELFDVLTLRMQYDDGFVAYLNGSEVARRNISGGVLAEWNSAANAAHPDGDAIVFEDIDLTGINEGLQAGVNILAIHGLNQTVSDDDFLIAAEFQGRSSVILTDSPRYFATPTPGAPNGTGSDDLGPIISLVQHSPAEPMDDQDLVVMATLNPTFAPVDSVTMRYRVQLSTTDTMLDMVDDGSGADAVGGDGVYSALITADAAAPGQFIRWSISASDTQGRVSQYPPFEDPINSAEYDGTVVHVDQPHNLPILHWLIANASGADNNRDGRFPASVYFEGEFYDNIGANRHGQSSGGFPVKSYDLDFNPGENFRWQDGEARVDDINLMTTFADKSSIRHQLAYETYRDADSTYHFVRKIRVHRNGAFHALYDMMENGDANWIKRLGKDDNGALYKMYNSFSSLQDTTIAANTEAEKKTRKFEGNQDLVDLFNMVVSAPLATRTNNMMDMVNLPATVNFLATRVMISERDCCHKNYYIYRDTEGSGEWEGMPWDLDLSFGRNWIGTFNYWDNNTQADNQLFVGSNNGFFNNAIFGVPYARQMYLRRVRTLMDRFLQSSDTLPTDRIFEKRVDEIAELIQGDAADDLVKNGTWTQGSGTPTFDTSHADYETLNESVQRMKTEYLEARREYVFNKNGNFSEMPDRQPDDVVIEFGAIDFNPSSFNQEEEYVELVNNNAIAVDISGWRLDGGIEHTFLGGTVIPAGFSLFVSPDVRSFRARSISPTGGQGRFVQGNYQGQLSARGETIVLLNHAGVTNRTLAFPGNPSLAQQYLRVTEIMYHPTPPNVGSPFTEQNFEYIELKNIGPVSVPLEGVKFMEGISFNFNTSTVPSLDPGQSVVLVQNEAAFVSRHGSAALIGGVYGGLLDNAGENLKLLDKTNEKIQEFEYNNSWYPTTDGLGFSLVIVDETAAFNTWGEKASWRPSGVVQGSPGDNDPQPPMLASILVSEALTHTDLPQVDAVELYNPTGEPVNVGGWFLSDDFNDPRKYHLEPDTFIAPDDYLVVYEGMFNPEPGEPPSFSLNSQGDEIYLFSGNGTDLTGYFHGHRFGAGANGVSFGRYITSQTNEHFVAQSANTLGAANALPLVGPIVISEIMYHPPDLPGGTDNQGDEYVELLNISDETVRLYDPAFPTNSWELRDGVRYKFPDTASLEAGEFLLVVSFDPADQLAAVAFRNHYGVPLSVDLYGPYSGKLDNAKEDVELFRPDNPDLNLTPFIRMDKVDYKDESPWAPEADGAGPSLNRVAVSQYGNDSVNWIASAPSPGMASPGGDAPTITVNPVSQTGVLTLGVTFMVEATGPAPLRYQWRFNGSSMAGATGSSLALTQLKLSDAGLYDVVVFNGGGSVISQTAVLDVAVPAVILAQPQSQSIRLGGEVVFSVDAVSSSSIAYQWKKNGEPIAGETDAIFAIDGVTEADGGEYLVEITDAVGTISSDPVTLLILVDPTFDRPYVSRYEVLEGGNVMIGLSTKGTLPIGYRWRKNSATLKTVNTYSHQDWLYLENVQLTDGGSVRYSCVITNEAFPSPGNITRPNIFLTVLADVDGDSMADQWELDNELDDPNADLDGDGMTNREEHDACTDPNDPQSYLRVEQISLDGQINLEFMAKSNKTYTIQYKDQIEMLNWTKLADVPASVTNNTAVLTDSPENGERYYRLVTPRQP